MARPPAPAEGDVARPAARTGRASGASSSAFARATCALGAAALGLALLLAGGVPRSTTPVSAPQAVPGVVPPMSGVVTSTPETVAPTTRLDALTGNPFAEHAPWVPSDSAAAAAADSAVDGPEAHLLDRLADVPTATWLLPESDPLGFVGERVAEAVGSAHAEGRVPVFVVYGVPGRDCVGGHSAGGLPIDEYRDWVAEIAAAAGPASVVVLEPDALALGNACALPVDRMQVLRDAVGILAPSTGQGPVTYVDAGHSAWLDADTAAARLRQVGVERVRGFSLNVAGYGHEALERAYGDRIVSRLGLGTHYVVDTGRAGAGSTGEWCNPAGRALGAEPAAVLDQGPMDARLWIKPPGESDGRCGGGPEAGTFWTGRAVEMARAAGW